MSWQLFAAISLALMLILSRTTAGTLVWAGIAIAFVAFDAVCVSKSSFNWRISISYYCVGVSIGLLASYVSFLMLFDSVQIPSLDDAQSERGWSHAFDSLGLVIGWFIAITLLHWLAIGAFGTFGFTVAISELIATRRGLALALLNAPGFALFCLSVLCFGLIQNVFST